MWELNWWTCYIFQNLKDFSKHDSICYACLKIEKCIAVYINFYKILVCWAYTKHMFHLHFTSSFQSHTEKRFVDSWIILNERFISAHWICIHVFVCAYVQHTMRKCSSSKKWILWIHCSSLSCKWLKKYSCWTFDWYRVNVCTAYAICMFICKTAFFWVFQELLFLNQCSNFIFNIETDV